MPRPLPIAGDCRRGRNAGFTLIEMVMVIVITGILAAIVAVFITKPVQGYVDSVRRAELTDVADVVVRRLAREIHIAVPNSLRVGDSNGNAGSCAAQAGVTCYIELIPTSGGGRYRDSGVNGDSSGAGGNSSLFTTNSDFDVLGKMPSNPAIVANDYIVVYNLGPGNAPANAYAIGDPDCSSGSNCNRARVAQTPSGNVIKLTLPNPFGTWPAGMRPPNNSFQVVPGSVKAVTYACQTVPNSSLTQNLTRYWGYGFNPSLSTTPPSSGNSALMASHITCTGVSYFSGLLSLTLRIYDSQGSGEYVDLYSEIHVDNTP